MSYFENDPRTPAEPAPLIPDQQAINAIIKAKIERLADECPAETLDPPDVEGNDDGDQPFDAAAIQFKSVYATKELADRIRAGEDPRTIEVSAGSRYRNNLEVDFLLDFGQAAFADGVPDAVARLKQYEYPEQCDTTDLIVAAAALINIYDIALRHLSSVQAKVGKEEVTYVAVPDQSPASC